MKAMYTAEAKATGGRNGHVKSSNDVLDLEVRSPKALEAQMMITLIQKCFCSRLCSLFR
jgi:organic hydroperoxide reductase OsmC/OhrA